MFTWPSRRVSVTGGASFIGSHLVDELVARGARVRVIDDLSSGRASNIDHHVRAGRVEFLEGDLSEPGVARRVLQGSSVVIHLAAAHGGRGYVDLHQAACASNLALDNLVFRACVDLGVEKVVYASSGCVYPNGLQSDPQVPVYLREDMVGPPYDADNMYGWAKLMGELTLRAYYAECGLKSAACRYFTVYGPRGIENHAVIAMIARAFLNHDPYEVWGTGEQIRNWTYIDDIVAGTLAAAERIDDARAVNLGTMERIRVADAAQMILRHFNRAPAVRFRPDMPTGPLNRVADNALAKELLGWAPRVPFHEGLRRTIEWYCAEKTYDEVAHQFDRLLVER